MRTIRKGIFETNSSSTHTLVISNEDTLAKKDFLYFDFDEFGWEFEEYNTPEERASYLWTYFVYMYSDYDSSTHTYDYSKALEWKDKLENILNNNGIKCEFADPYIKDTGYIDHGNELNGFFESMIENDNDKLINYLFGSDSAIYTGNDNCEKYECDTFDYKINKAEQKGYEVYYKGN